MIDLHAHILPNMDDGSASVEESMEMLTQMRKTGITTVVATPHFDMRRENIEQFLKRRERAYQSLTEAAKGVEIPTVLLGAEVLYCGVGLSHIEGIEELCLGNGRYLLVETLKGIWDTTFVSDMQKLMAEQNITPILAHVERYIGVRKNKKLLSAMQTEGMMAQANAEFILSWRFRCVASKMLREKRIHVLGSDCHNTTRRKPNLAEAMEMIRENLGETMVQKLTMRAEGILF